MDSNTTPTTPTSTAPVKKESFWKELIKFTLLAVVIVMPIRIFIAQPFIVSGASMDPTFWDGEYLIVDEISYRFEEPKRGEVIIFRYPLDPSKYFIKRVVGLPGESLHIKGIEITVDTPSGKSLVLNEPYVSSEHQSPFDNISVTLGSKEYYVLGDNRSGSSDSRRWGPLPRANIIGRPLLRLIPPTKLALFPGAYQTSTDAPQ